MENDDKIIEKMSDRCEILPFYPDFNGENLSYFFYYCFKGHYIRNKIWLKNRILTEYFSYYKLYDEFTPST